MTKQNKISDRQSDTRYFSPNFLVLISSSANDSRVVARLPEELQMQLASEWDTPLVGSTPGWLEIGAQELLGKSFRTQFASSQVWSGSSPIEITLPLEFYAESNPKTEVISPIVELAKMALPRKSGEGGQFIPPGPRIFGLREQTGNDFISIEIGNFLIFTKVIITQVNPTFVTRDMTKLGLPLKASCEVTFRTMFSLSGGDFARMFKDIK
ncbi:MAG: hypothetical protein HKO92_11425 [Flavobacteriaceae bacterium]|nr:hypothetical protein [Flavobacteriaceae bacterium]